MRIEIPSEMTAVCLDEGDRLVARRISVPKPSKGEVLVKISAAPVNPSDINRIRHLSASDKKHFVAGIEGSGLVVAHGKGILPSIWMGRKVACTSTHISSGTWSEYMVTSAMACVPLTNGITEDQGSMLLVNPLTAVAFINIAKAGGHKSFINTAASGALGRMIELLAIKHRIELIQVVRSSKQKERLLSAGARYVIDSSEQRFEVGLHSIAKKLNTTLAFDAVGGDMTRRLLLSIPYGSHVVVYGNLSGDQPLVDHRSLVTENKCLSGFYLVNWLKEKGILNTLSVIREARSMMNGKHSVAIRAHYKLEEAQIAVDNYLTNMSAGKVLLHH